MEPLLGAEPAVSMLPRSANVFHPRNQDNVKEPPAEWDEDFVPEWVPQDDDQRPSSGAVLNSRDSKAADHNPNSLADAHMAQTVAERALEGRYCWTSGLDWMKYTIGRWKQTTAEHVAEVVRQDVIRQHAQEAKAGASPERLKAVTGLLAAHRIRSIVQLAKGILEKDAAAFDRHPDLLNVGNGVVDLRTGKLLAHDPELLFTKITKVSYVSCASSSDWTTALTALPREVAEWMQVRIGQAATGHPTADDILPVAQGGGANSKTTFFGALQRALGDHAVVVPERVLMANPSDHPTELMTLRGVRLALIEETPEARHLNVKRLKDTVGQPTMAARLIRQNNVTWETTHTLFVTTNYVPRVDETDHGTWRRLALVRFPYTYLAPGEITDNPMAQPAVPGLRERLREGRQGQHEAVLAWIIEGALRWYVNNRLIPPAPKQVRDDTQAWRAEADLIVSYGADRLYFEPGAHIVATELYDDFTKWLEDRGHRPWGENTFSSRIANHTLIETWRVYKKRTRSSEGEPSRRGPMHPLPTQYSAWHGVRFRTERDPAQSASDKARQGSVQGGHPASGESL